MLELQAFVTSHELEESVQLYTQTALLLGNPATYQIEGWMGRKTSLHISEERKTSCLDH
jgi:hypothetical protein